MSLKIKVKVCGMTSLEQIEALTKMTVEYAGLIFYDKSPRYVRNKLEGEDLADVSERIKLAGVFVNESIDVIKQTIKEYHLDAVQLCGEESVADCDELRYIVEVFKVLPVRDKETTQEWINKYRGHCDFFLFDTHSDKYGGTGEKFEWKQLKRMPIRHFFFLSGGIAPEDAEKVKKFREAHYYGIDINSRFEIEPGVKDMEKIKDFIDELKAIH